MDNENNKPRDILEYFVHDHLPTHLRLISKPFAMIAHRVDAMDGDPREKAVALRKLLEAKDAAVRAAIPYQKNAGVTA